MPQFFAVFMMPLLVSVFCPRAIYADSTEDTFNLPFLGHEKRLSVSDIESWLTRGENPVTNVEDFIDELPDMQKSGRTFMYKSRSLQKATPHQPRVIFFGPDARLLIAISTVKSDPMYNVVEIIEYDEIRSQFDFYTIDFNQNVKEEIVTKNPKICSSCHRQDKRPNWESYSTWPGAYGSFHDRVHGQGLENKHYREFVVQSSNDKRLKRLGFDVPKKYIEGTQTLYTVSLGGGSNAVMGAYISALNFHRIAHRITEIEGNKRYRHAILASLIKCSNPIEEFIPLDLRQDHTTDYETLYNETKENIEKHYWRNVKTAFELQKFQNVDMEEFAYWQGESDRTDLREDNIKRITNLRYLLEKRETNPMPVGEWSTNLGYYGKYSYSDGFGSLRNLLYWYGKLALSVEEKKLIGWQPQFLMISPSSGTGVYNMIYKSSPETCEQLKSLVN